MSVREYATTFTGGMRLVPHLVPTKLYKIDKFTKGLSMDISPKVKIAKNMMEAIWSAKNVKTQI